MSDATPPDPTPQLPSIEGLRAYEAAARLGSFERAADELAVTASAIGKRVATLEELLGTPLLLRSAKALTLTRAGREYLERVHPALDLLLALPQHQRALQRSERRVSLRRRPSRARPRARSAMPRAACASKACPMVRPSCASGTRIN